jgi:hypothetical protein
VPPRAPNPSEPMIHVPGTFQAPNATIVLISVEIDSHILDTGTQNPRDRTTQ